MIENAPKATVTDTRGAADYIKRKTGISVSPRTLQGHRGRGIGARFMRIAGRVAYRFQDLDGYIDSCVVEPRETPRGLSNQDPIAADRGSS